jgi:hypothetical protein
MIKITDNKATLKIVIKSEWFDEIASGKKKIEYREIKPFWESRLYDAAGKKRLYGKIEFINGYNVDAKRMITKYEGFERKGKYFNIKVGKILKKPHRK